MALAIPVAEIPIIPDEANNPFAAPAGPAPEGMPPDGVQEPGEFGPYYIYQGDTLVELPAVNIVRDYDYAYKVTEVDFQDFIGQSWTNGFESSAILCNRPLKSRSVVVLSNNGWMTGDKTVYTWCIRIDVKVENVDGVSMGRVPDDTETGEVSELLRYGRHILWPVPPVRANNARERWANDEALRESRLVQTYVPSSQPFAYTNIPNYEIVQSALPTTLRLVQSVKPLHQNPMEQAMKPAEELAYFCLDEHTTEETQLVPRYASSVSSSGLAPRTSQCMRFTAKDDVGWRALPDDLQEHIWEMLSNVAINTKGRLGSDSLTLWLRLRRVCRQSKNVVDRLTRAFMKEATNAMLETRNFQLYSALRVRNLLVPRGINPHKLQLEINYKEAKFVADAVWSSVHSYMRIRTGKAPTEPAPTPVSRRSPQFKQADMCHPFALTFGPAAMALPVPKPERSSMRLGIRRSKQPSPSLAGSSSDSPMVDANAQGETPSWSRISFKLGVPPKDESPKLEKTEKAEKTEIVSWVQCEACDKWRRLPCCPALNDYLSVQYLPKHWFCDFHPSGVTCDDPEDAMDTSEVTHAEFRDGATNAPQHPQALRCTTKRLRSSARLVGTR